MAQISVNNLTFYYDGSFDNVFEKQACLNILDYLLQDFKFIEVILWKLFYALLAVLQQPKPLS